MPTVTSSNLSKLIPIYYDRKMLEILVPQLMFKQFAVPKELPKHEGQSVDL